jgi:hypothetical protein
MIAGPGCVLDLAPGSRTACQGSLTVEVQKYLQGNGAMSGIRACGAAQILSLALKSPDDPGALLRKASSVPVSPALSRPAASIVRAPDWWRDVCGGLAGGGPGGARSMVFWCKSRPLPDRGRRCCSQPARRP